MVKKNACVFISGKGTNLKNLILRSRDYNFPVNIKLVVSNRKDAPGIIYAKKNLIPLLLVSILQHIWSLKIKNDSFLMQIEIVRRISTNN